jgi:hypothetical protein
LLLLHIFCLFQCHGYTKFSNLFFLTLYFRLAAYKLSEGVLVLILKKGVLLLILKKRSTCQRPLPTKDIRVNAIPLLYYVFKHRMKRLVLELIYMYIARQNNDSTNPFNLYWAAHSLCFTLYRKHWQYYIQTVISAFR